ncbi:uncharacterized protein GBIM_08458 [Gryllus bimaculatus]|nr:uncharacterized protein GBIM_08458 [Gryllus bimaculatus]
MPERFAQLCTSDESANEQTKIDLLERRLMGADVASTDLTGLMDDDEDDAFDAYRLALVTSQFAIGAETPSPGSTTICISVEALCILLRQLAYPNRLTDLLLQSSVFPDKQYVIYGDSGYPKRQLLLRPFQGRNISEDQQSFNAAMSGLRQSVEWGFAKVVNEFAFIDFKKNQKLLLQDVGSMYKIAVLSNCHTCLYGSQVVRI